MLQVLYNNDIPKSLHECDKVLNRNKFDEGNLPIIIRVL